MAEGANLTPAGPETMTMLEMLQQFAICHGNSRFTPVHIGYRNMEKIVNIKSLGTASLSFPSVLSISPRRQSEQAVSESAALRAGLRGSHHRRPIGVGGTHL